MHNQQNATSESWLAPHGQPVPHSHARPDGKWGFRFLTFLVELSLRKQGLSSGIIRSSQSRDILLRDLASATVETKP